MNKVEFIKEIMDKMIQENGRCCICDTPTDSFLRDEKYEVDNLITNACQILGIESNKEKYSNKEKEYLTYVIAGMISTHKHIWICEKCLSLIDQQECDTLIEKIIDATKSYLLS